MCNRQWVWIAASIGLSVPLACRTEQRSATCAGAQTVPAQAATGPAAGIIPPGKLKLEPLRWDTDWEKYVHPTPGKPFGLTWLKAPSKEQSQTSLWLHRTTKAVPRPDEQWLRQLMTGLELPPTVWRRKVQPSGDAEWKPGNLQDLGLPRFRDTLIIARQYDETPRAVVRLRPYEATFIYESEAFTEVARMDYPAFLKADRKLSAATMYAMGKREVVKRGLWPAGIRDDGGQNRSATMRNYGPATVTLARQFSFGREIEGYCVLHDSDHLRFGVGCDGRLMSIEMSWRETRREALLAAKTLDEALADLNGGRGSPMLRQFQGGKAEYLELLYVSAEDDAGRYYPVYYFSVTDGTYRDFAFVPAFKSSYCRDPVHLVVPLKSDEGRPAQQQ